MLLGEVAEGAVTDFQEFGGLGADAVGAFQGGLEVALFSFSYDAFEVDTFWREYDAVAARA
jgi:hypothetical protein